LTNLDLKIPRIFQELVLSAVLDIIMDLEIDFFIVF
jgi:hypothetical protein